jgi:hypothetical protein
MKRTLFALAGAVGIVIALAVITPQTLRPTVIASDAELFCRACEAVLSKRLRSPSTYDRLECPPPVIRPATLDEFLGWNWPGKEEDYLRLSSKNPDIKRNHEFIRDMFVEGEDGFARTTLTYEASNAFGTPIRGTAVCENVLHGSLELQSGGSADLGIRINGETALGWSMRALE